MFESITRQERFGVARLALVVAVTAVVFGAQLWLFAGTVARPLAVAVAGVQAPPQVDRDALPEFEEEILVVAPYRPRRVVHARAVPWRDDGTWAAPRYAVECPAH